MKVLAIDPGNEASAFCVYAYAPGGDLFGRKVPNDEMLAIAAEPIRMLGSGGAFIDHIAIEMIASYGMPVGREVFETCVWIGRFVQATKLPYKLVYRRDVKLHLCGQARAKDPHIRQALIDRFGPGKEAAIGTKAHPGRLYGFKADVWAALAVAVTFADGAVREDAA